MELAHVRNDRTIRCVVIGICYGERYSVADRVECFNGLFRQEPFIASVFKIECAEETIKIYSTMSIKRNRRNALCFAESLISEVCTARRPVRIGAEIDELAAVFPELIPNLDGLDTFGKSSVN